MTVLSLLPFPPVLWWQAALQAPGPVGLDGMEPYRKMGHRSRYRIAASGGPLWLTIPIVGGREQRCPVSEIRIDNRTPWQRNHWRSLVSVYRRTAFFEHYAPALEPLFLEPVESLAAFNGRTLAWSREQLELPLSFEWLSAAHPAPPGATDRRERWLNFSDALFSYAQPFAERTGFVPGMCILDLLFAEGPASASLLARRREEKMP